MRKIVLNLLPYGILCLVTLILIMIWWPLEGGWVALTNSWIALFFVCVFCAIFLFQEDIYHFLDRNIKSNFLGSTDHYKNIVIFQSYLRMTRNFRN